MVDYFHEFEEYISFLKKKILRNTINQVYSTNLIKLALLLNNTEINNPQFRKWLLVFHNACKKSKLNSIPNRHLKNFEVKLIKISKKILSEMTITDICKINRSSIFKNEKISNGKIRKLIYNKKVTRYIPIELKRLIGDVSFYIGESVNEKEIDMLSFRIPGENINVKRKRFSKQIKESLIKYFNDFNNLTVLESQSSSKKSIENEFKELDEYLQHFDSKIICGTFSKSESEIETFVNSKDSLETFQFNDDIKESPLDEKTQSLQIEEVDFNDFDVVEEWNDCVTSEVNPCLNNEISMKITDNFISDFADIQQYVLSNIGTKNVTGNSNNTYEHLRFEVLPEYMNSLGGNKTISNLQESFLLDFQKRLNSFLKIDVPDKEIESSIDDDVLCNRTLYSKPKPSIKIMNLKKPYVYLSVENPIDSNCSEVVLENIPLPNKILNKNHIICNSTNKTTKSNPEHFTEESDTPEEELIPQSILDFSDVLNDEFDSREHIESSTKIHDSSNLINIDNCDNCQENSLENRSVILKKSNPEEIQKPLSFINNEICKSTSVDENEEQNCVFEIESNKIKNSMNVQYNRPENNAYNSNYSIFSISENYTNDDCQSYYFNRKYDEYIYNNDDAQDLNYYYSDGNRSMDYYNSGVNRNMTNNNFNVNNYRNYDRGNRRLFRNFLRYTSQSNNTERRWLGESQRFNTGFD